MAQQFLCIGGPLNGKTIAWDEVPDTYFSYNRSGSTKKIPSMIFIHSSLLYAGEAPELPRMPRRRKAQTTGNQDLQVWEVEREV